MGQLRSKRKAPANANANATATATMPEENLNPISCEVCRQRKCKCDRRLPFCSQCAGEPSKCIYPESGKRGLPLGYLNQLEQRLAETESALYGALTTLRSIGQSATPVPRPEVPKQKATRMEEWSQLPIREWSDLEHWMTVMSDQFSGQTRATSENYAIPGTLDARDSHPAPYAWQGDSRIDGRISGNYEPHDPVMASPYFPAMDEVMSSPGSSSRQGIGAVDDTVGVSESGSTRAEELSHRNPSLYF